MNKTKTTKALLAIACVMSLSACSGMTPREQNTATGAAVGAAAGALITGSPLGTATGAAVGGVIGHETTPRR